MSFFHLLAVICSFFSLYSPAYANKVDLSPKSVAISQIVEHPSLDKVRLELISFLETKGYKVGENLTVFYENAHGSLPTSAQIAKKIVSLKPDLVIAIATPAAQALAAQLGESGRPMVFAAITDPVEAQLVRRLDGQDQNITGVIDAQPVQEQVLLIQKVLPKIKKIGVIYNAGEVNSVKGVNLLREAAKNLEIIETTIVQASDVMLALNQLLPEVEAIYLPTDNLVVSALPAIIQVASSHKKPVFSADPDLVEQGVLASVGVSYQDVGRIAGVMSFEILQGKKVADIPIRGPEKNNLIINKTKAKEIGMSLSSDLLKEAARTF